MIKETFEVSLVVRPRSKYEVLSQLMEEVGELATEVSIAEGYSNKETNEGIISEGVDVITCVLDLIWLGSPNITEEELEADIMAVLQQKLQKWKKKGG